MKLSIIVATYNRKNELESLLDSFAHQSLPSDRFEVIIVDDGSTDSTRTFITDIRQSLPFTLHYEYQENRGPGYARTRGMERATGDVFLFIDSDCIAPPHYLESVRRAFMERPIDAFGGPDRTADDFSAWDKAVNYTMTSFLTTGGLRGTSGKKLATYYPRSFNMGFRSEVFQKIGGFGSIYHYGEDIEFSHRIIKSGARVAFLPDAYVFHRRRSSPGLFARQVYKMGRARVQLGRIDRALLEPLHFIPLAIVLFVPLLLITALAVPEIRPLYFIPVGIGIVTGLSLVIHGAMHMRDFRAALAIPFVFGIQIGAYGTGMLAEILKPQRAASAPEEL
jgi:GT2 family glycosyltransferase